MLIREDGLTNTPLLANRLQLTSHFQLWGRSYAERRVFRI